MGLDLTFHGKSQNPWFGEALLDFAREADLLD
jgi:hypothetical protein